MLENPDDLQRLITGLDLRIEELNKYKMFWFKQEEVESLYDAEITAVYNLRNSIQAKLDRIEQQEKLK